MPTSPLRSSRAVLLAATVAVGALALTGCSVIEGIFPAQAERNSETNEVETAGESDVFQMAVGDCIDDQAATEVESVPAVPCSDPHDWEVYYTFDIEGSEYPGETEVSTLADDGCYEAFPDFVGISWDESALDFNYYVPTSGSWSMGDQEIVCLVGDPAGKQTGTLAGAAR